jgi:hypothetical protein
MGQWTIYTHPKVQPAALYCSLATWAMLEQSDGNSGSCMARFMFVMCRLQAALTAHKPAHAHDHGHGLEVEVEVQKKRGFLRELRHKGGCCCFGWAVYAPHGHVVCRCGYDYTTPNRQYGRLLPSLLPDLTGGHMHMATTPVRQRSHHGEVQ